MIRPLLFILLSSFSLGLNAQLIVKPLQKSNNGSQSRQLTDTTITLPIYDDFSRYDTPDPNVWEFGNTVLVSPSAGINPPTINVAVFDGVNEVGAPYNDNNFITTATDSLISFPIAMSQVPVNKRNSIYLSFFWQAKGLGEMPDPADSLTLHFLNSDSVWINQDLYPEDLLKHGLVGGEEALNYDPNDTTQLMFQQLIVPITNEEYHHDNFRIKFQNYGSSQGPFDSWLIDYVYVNYDRGPDSLFYEDRAMTKLPTSPFGEFYAIPFDHFLDTAELFAGTIDMESFTLVRPGIPDPLNYYVEVIDSTGTIIDQVNIDTEVAGTSTNARNQFESNEIRIDDYFTFDDTLNFEIKAYLDTQDSLNIPNANSSYYSYRYNDTISHQYTMERYYAYDDGTAEFAAGISISEGRLVIAYPIHSRDTLTHIDINFPQIVPGEQGDQLDILVLKDLSGSEESELVIQEDFKISQAATINQFTRIKLKKQPIVEDTIYIGFEQKVNRYVPVGLDKNTDFSRRVYTRIDEEWEQNLSVPGTLMIRPVFGTPFLPVSVEEPVLEPISLYPNPSSSLITINGQFDEVKVYDLRGIEQVVQRQGDQIDISHFSSGIYVAVFTTSDSIKTIRFVKN